LSDEFPDESPDESPDGAVVVDAFDAESDESDDEQALTPSSRLAVAAMANRGRRMRTSKSLRTCNLSALGERR
jgi:hypothetical protein